MKTTTDVQQSKEETLGKKLSLYDFFVIGFGAIIGATGTYAPLPLAAKFMLTWNMVMGRLELFVVLALLNRGFWRGNSKW